MTKLAKRIEPQCNGPMRYFLLPLCLLILGGCASTGSQGATQDVLVPESEKASLVQTAQTAVRNQLKSPATATLDPESVPRVSADYSPSKDMTTIYVWGQVDASNVYGAILRKSYVVSWKWPGQVQVSSRLVSPSTAEVYFLN